MRPNTKPSIYLKHDEIFFAVICLNVFNMWPKTTLLPVQCGPETPKGWAPPLEAGSEPQSSEFVRGQSLEGSAASVALRVSVRRAQAR